MALEQHPVPQNITSFQFRLIGDMTVKQFGFLAVFTIVAYIIYKSPLPAFFSIPLAAASFLLGFGLAFVPIEERPMDVWVLSFIKSIYAPTLYVWQKEKPVAVQSQKPPPIQQPTVKTAPPTAKQHALPQAVKPVIHPTDQAASIQPAPMVAQTKTVAKIVTVSKKSGGFWAFIHDFLNPKPTAGRTANLPPAIKTPTPAPIVVPKPQPPVVIKSQPQTDKGRIFTNLQTPSITGNRLNIEEPKKTTDLEKTAIDQQKILEQEQIIKQNKTLEDKLNSLQKELSDKSATESRLVELQKQLSQVLSERNKMQEELIRLREDYKKQSQPAPPPQTMGVAETKTVKTPTVKVINADTAVHAGLPKLTTFPNVVTGIIKDFDSNMLPGVLVTVRDKDGIPLRALKTNKLGQFAASTPLPDGTYLIEIEDPRSRYVFDRVQISLNGTLLPAIEIVAKSQKQISREKLSKEIFGNQTPT